MPAAALLLVAALVASWAAVPDSRAATQDTSEPTHRSPGTEDRTARGHVAVFGFVGWFDVSMYVLFGGGFEAGIRLGRAAGPGPVHTEVHLDLKTYAGFHPGIRPMGGVRLLARSARISPYLFGRFGPVISMYPNHPVFLEPYGVVGYGLEIPGDNVAAFYFEHGLTLFQGVFDSGCPEVDCGLVTPFEFTFGARFSFGRDVGTSP